MQETYSIVHNFRVRIWLAACASLAAVCAEARLKDSVDLYVQDGLQLNYDGIRNAGVSAAHDADAATWVNLGSLGTGYNLARLRDDGASEGWQADGYTFWGANAFWVKKNLEIPVNYTVQVLVDAKTADQTKGNMGYIFFPGGTDANGKNNWQYLSLVVREDSNSAGKRTRLNNNNATGSSSAPDLAGTAFTYLTAQLNGTDKWTALFSGTTPPTSGDNYKVATTPTATTFASTWALGGNADTSKKTTGQGLRGTIKSFRFYNRVLAPEELEWNRKVDEARFFGGAMPALSVTNAVVASSPSFLGGSEANGVYAVDGEGYTFTAPATKTDRGIDYELTGYSLETWDAEGGVWGEPVEHAGENACAVTDAGKVRITWKYRAVSGLVTPALATGYGVEDYVQDGLIVNYDGIRNVGANLPHDPNALVWRNVAPAGGHHMTRYCYPTNVTNVKVDAEPGVYDDGSMWTDDGFFFSGRGSHFWCEDKVTLGQRYTMQALVDARPSDQTVNTITYIMSTSPWNYSTIGIRNQKANDTPMYLVVDTQLGDSGARRPSLAMRARYEYATGMVDTFDVGGQEVTGAAFFDGTRAPAYTELNASEWPTSGWLTGRVATANSTKLVLGGFHGSFSIASAQMFAGKVKSFRLYDRVLTTAELELNRRVDDARFFGTLVETNVVVETSHSFLSGAEAVGVYGVLKSHTFTAPTAATDRGIDYALVGYTLETWDATKNEWGAAVSCAGANYTYTTGSSPAKVRLVWQWKATRGLRTAADYDVQDYAPVGLVLNYDGIRNVGAGAPHDAKVRGWVNAAPCGGRDLVWGGGTINWKEDGFAFDKKSVFNLADLGYLPPAYTFQTLVDATTTDQNGIGYILFGRADGDDNSYWKKCSLGIRSSAYNNETDTYYFVADTPLGGRAWIHDVDCSYATAIMNKTYALMFPGVDQADTPGKQRRNASSGMSNPGYDFPKGFVVGGVDANNGQNLKGRLKSFRYYDRVLTNEELVRNRNVDSARYFGTLATTNVFVRPAKFGNGQTETGAFKVEGSWTFTAGAAIDGKGEPVSLAGYVLETLKNGEWTDRTLHTGSSYTYEEGMSPATVRLTWRWNVGLIVIVE